MEHAVLQRDFELLDEFKNGRARIVAAQALDRDAAAESAKRRSPQLKPSVITTVQQTSPKDVSTGVQRFTQAPQYAGREEALAAKQQTEEEIKTEKTQVWCQVLAHAHSRAFAVAAAAKVCCLPPYLTANDSTTPSNRVTPRTHSIST